MANEEHLKILQQGVEVWNRWREENPSVQPDLRQAEFSGAEFSGAEFSGAKLSGAELSGAELSGANLEGANLQAAFLVAASLIEARLERANLLGANLYRANLYRASLDGTHLVAARLDRASLFGVSLERATFQGAFLYRANFTAAQLGQTIFADVDLREVTGLGLVKHLGPSTIGIDTLYRSGGAISEVFLRGCGVPDAMIEYAQALVTAAQPIQYYSCFISYSSADEAVAKRLHADLQAAGVRCWFAPEDLKIGDSILEGIDQAIRLHEKLLIILSEASMASRWVQREVRAAQARELREGRPVLFPVRIDAAVRESQAGWAAELWEQRHIGDFCRWKEHDAYQQAFGRLLRDLKAASDTEPRA